MAKPTAKQIAQGFHDFLYDEVDHDLPTGHGRMVLTNYDKFAELHQRDRVSDSLYEHVYTAGLELGILIGFGENGIFVGTDDNFGIALRWNYQPK